MKDLRKRCKAVIDSCVTIEQMKVAKRYIELAELNTDALTVAWYDLKYNLIGEI